MRSKKTFSGSAASSASCSATNVEKFRTIWTTSTRGRQAIGVLFFRNIFRRYSVINDGQHILSYGILARDTMRAGLLRMVTASIRVTDKQ